MWTEEVEALTGVYCIEDIEPLYDILLNTLLSLREATKTRFIDKKQYIR